MHADLRRAQKKLKKLYSKIPKFECIPGCHQCCGVVPWAGPEFVKVEDNPKVADVCQSVGNPGTITPMQSTVCMDCPFYDEKGCTVYEERPFLCRLYGTTEILPCVRGVKPKVMLSAKRAAELTDEYRALVKQYPVDQPGIKRIKINFAASENEVNTAVVVGLT